jgi:hypothetical protein
MLRDERQAIEKQFKKNGNKTIEAKRKKRCDKRRKNDAKYTAPTGFPAPALQGGPGMLTKKSETACAAPAAPPLRRERVYGSTHAQTIW